jgi:hypothetical protein
MFITSHPSNSAWEAFHSEMSLPWLLIKMRTLSWKPRGVPAFDITRVRLCRRVSLESGNERLEGTTLDLSLGGALVQSHRAFPTGIPVTLTLELEAGTPPMRSGSRVIRTIGTDCMGIQFETLGPKESNRLQQVLLPLILAAN